MSKQIHSEIFNAKRTEGQASCLLKISQEEVDKWQEYVANIEDKESLQSVRFCLRFLFDRRIKKVMEMVFQRSSYPESIIEYKNLLSHEKEFFEELLKIFPTQNPFLPTTVEVKT